MLLRRALLLFLAIQFLHSVPLFAKWNSFIINIDKKAHGHGTQTWQIDPYDGRWTYFANKNGLLQFDGTEWSLFALNNMKDVRSVRVSDINHRIYVGGINEFGYFTPNAEGRLVYNCLSDSLPPTYQSIGNVWNIHMADKILYFIGDNALIKYVGNKATLLPTNRKIDCSSVIDDILYIGTDEGVYFLAGNTFFPLQGAENIKDLRVRQILPYDGGMIIATAYDGLYFYAQRQLRKIDTDVEDFLRNNEVFCAAINGHHIAIGTIHKGIIIIDLRSKQHKYFNESTGLYNNTVLSVSFDVYGNLWAGLDNGIDYIQLSLPYTNLYSYPNAYGSGYAAAAKDNILYLGTNRGLYCTPYPVQMGEEPPHIRLVDNSSGQVWNLCTIGDELFCAHDRGLFLVEGNSARRVTNILGAWQCQPVMGRDNLVYVGTYDGLYVIEKTGQQWQVRNKVLNLNTSCRIFEQESDNVVWVDNTDRAVRYELNANLDSVAVEREYTMRNGFPTKRHMVVSEIEGQICFATAKGVYRYVAAADTIEPYTELNNRLNGRVQYTRLVDDGRHIVGLSRYQLYVTGRTDYRSGSDMQAYSINPGFVEQMPDFESVVPMSDSLFIIPNVKGFALLTLNKKRNADRQKNGIFISRMALTAETDSLVYVANYQGKKPEPIIDYDYNSVRFDYGIYPFEDNEIHIQYKLNGDEWSDYTSARTKEYTNMREGSYTFTVRTIFPDGTMSQDSMDFTVLSPWYRNTWAYCMYVVLFLVLLAVFYLINDRVVQVKKHEAIAEKEKQMKEMEKAYEREKEMKETQIMMLEKEKLQHDLEHKNQEMTNLMINVMRKNEMLTDIKTEISKVASNLRGRGAAEGIQDLLLIINKIDSNITSDELLERIEREFDLLHNNFMKRLNAKYPTLSRNERMMCVYLVMNLSTKEIAPLLNISVRGVETIRYRLRKKFDLDRDDNMVDFLTNGL